MRRILGATLAVGLVILVAGAAFAYGPRGPMMGYGPGYGPMMGQGEQGGPMGPGWMGGPGRMGGGRGNCPGMAGAPGTPGGPGAGEPQAAITEDKARELATAYVDKYLKGFTVERVLPFTGRMGTMYQVELKGPKGEKRALHVNPWGNVRPFGPMAAAE